MSWMKEWIVNECKPRVEKLKQQLAEYSDGSWRLKQSNDGETWEDYTEDFLNELRSEIAIYEKIIERFKEDGAA